MSTRLRFLPEFEFNLATDIEIVQPIICDSFIDGVNLIKENPIYCDSAKYLLPGVSKIEEDEKPDFISSFDDGARRVFQFIRNTKDLENNLSLDFYLNAALLEGQAYSNIPNFQENILDFVDYSSDFVWARESVYSGLFALGGLRQFCVNSGEYDNKNILLNIMRLEERILDDNDSIWAMIDLNKLNISRDIIFPHLNVYSSNLKN